jgi:hypothetical protein
MSFNKYYIPEPAALAEQVKTHGVKHAVSRKIDTIIGNPVSIEIFDFMWNSMRTNTPELEIMESLSQKYPDYFNAKSN